MKVAAALLSVLVFWQASGAISLVGAPESLVMMLWGAVLLALGSLLSGAERTPAPAEFSQPRPAPEKTPSTGYASKAA